MFKAQVDLMRSKLGYPKKGKNSCRRRDDVEISTVDAFQGAQKDIIILDTVTLDRSFTANPNRINVALTRARHHLVVVGKFIEGQLHPIWAHILQAARDSNG